MEALEPREGALCGRSRVSAAGGKHDVTPNAFDVPNVDVGFLSGDAGGTIPALRVHRIVHGALAISATA